MFANVLNELRLGRASGSDVRTLRRRACRTCPPWSRPAAVTGAAPPLKPTITGPSRGARTQPDAFFLYAARIQLASKLRGF
jgi:hypothetical protein